MKVKQFAFEKSIHSDILDKREKWFRQLRVKSTQDMTLFFNINRFNGYILNDHRLNAEYLLEIIFKQVGSIVYR